MPDFVLSRPDVFPSGTTVRAYPTSNWAFANLPPSGSPPGDPASEEAATATGVTFEDIDAGSYYAHAEVTEDVHRYLAFSVPAPAEATGGGDSLPPDGEDGQVLTIISGEAGWASPETVALEDGAVTNAKVAADAAIAESKLDLASDAAAGTASRRTLGTSGTQAAAGDDSRLSDTRVPTDDSVSTVKIQDGAVTADKLADELATQAALTAHIDDTAAAHAATAVSYAGGTGMSATDVEAALDELATEKANASALTDHTSDTTAAHAASAISYGGGTGMSATDVEAALDELATEKANASDLTAHLSDTSDAHDASAISITSITGVTATDVQAALAEIASEAKEETHAFYQPADLVVGAGVNPMVWDYDVTLLSARAVLSGDASGTCTVDVNINGTTAYSSGKPSISAGNDQGSAATPTSSAVAAGARVTVDLDAIDEDDTGLNLTVFVKVRRA